MKLQEQLKVLEDKIRESYESGVSLDEAEKLASQFLHAQLQISTELTKVDLDARMKKSGLKAIRAKAYLDIISGADKKPTEAQISAVIDSDEIVGAQQQMLDEAETKRGELERYYDILNNAHIHYRGVAKGRFE